MRVKFSSRTSVGASETRATTSTPIFITYFITTCFLFCTTTLTSTCAQRVFWMYSPLPQINGVMGYNSFDNSVAPATKSVLMLLPIYHNKNDHSQPKEYQPIYQRSIMGYNHPVITPLIVEQHGSKSPSWPGGEVYHKRNEKIKRRNYIESVMINQNILGMGKREEDHQNGDNSGSAEETSFINQLYEDDNGYDADGGGGGEAVVLDKRVHVIRQKCRREGDLARFDPVTGACYTIGTKGPCGHFMMFTAVPGDNLNGQCDCDYDSFDRPLVRVGDQCHFLYTQAICYPGYWLTGITPNYEATCEQNPCYHPHIPLSSSEPSKNSVVLFKGECINLNSSSSHCRREGEVVLFPKGSVKPACGFPKSTRRIFRRQISNVTRFACRPGMRRHRVTKRCVRSRSIVFSAGGF